MKQYFTEAQIAKKIHLIDIAEDDLLLEGAWLESTADNTFIIGGIATIEGERYHDFQIEFAPATPPPSTAIEDVMDVDWDWYDYLCD